MDLIYIGDVTNTHGLKGEIRILSDFKYKDDVFKIGVKLYIGHDLEELTIKTYRKHKMYDMVSFDGLNDINDVIGYKGDKVYIDRNKVHISGILNEDIIGLEVYDNDNLVGIVDSVLKSEAHEIIVVKNDDNKFMIPYVKEFINKIDLSDKKIYINKIKGLIDEN